MGIVNCTPDSFYANSRRLNEEQALETALDMVKSGADILDIGGESTRPGAPAVNAEEQIQRIVPVIQKIRQNSLIPISVDTRLASVAQAALDAGATMVNDISALEGDEAMGPLVAQRQVPIVLMHMQGIPETMQNNPHYHNVVQDVCQGLQKAVDRALAYGIHQENIILDPGIGFGKRQQDNAALLAHLSKLRLSNLPLLVGLSRKSFLGAVLAADQVRLEEGRPSLYTSEGELRHSLQAPPPPEDRGDATLAAHAWCLQANVDILRVHDVKQTRQLLAIWEAIAWAS
ncbi:MAG: dihydropteroate synthase [Spirochaetales bacterium]|nr:dihydropteroate synthase [Spirochaetales bacterium]